MFQQRVYLVFPVNSKQMQVKLNVSIVIKIHFQNYLVHLCVLHVQRKESRTTEVFNVKYVEKVKKK